MKRALAVLIFALIFSAACNQTHRAATGFHLDLATVQPEPCGDGRNVRVTALGNNKVRINGDEFEVNNLASRLEQILQYREYKWAFVNAAPGISVADLVEVLDEMNPADIVSLATTQVTAKSVKTQCLLEPSCGQCINWQLNQRLPVLH